MSKEANQDGEKPKEMTSAQFYFDSNSHFGTHEELLKDRVRTRAFMRATLNNKHLFNGKNVLDIGTGTGILAMLAVKAGAKHVYAVESSGIAHIAKAIVKKNGMDKQITVIEGKMEEVKLPVEKVDIIVCDWMGYALVQSSMISTIINARDRYLVKGGLIFPDRATLHICGIEDAEYKEQRIGFWDNVYGFNMSCMKEGSHSEPLIDMCQSQQVVTSFDTVHSIDLNTATVDCMNISSKFTIQAKRRDFCHALVLYFDVYFNASHKPIHFSTGPKVQFTHWKQCVVYLDEEIPLHSDEKIVGTLKVNVKGETKEKLSIEIGTKFEGKSTKLSQSRVYRYG